MNKVIHAANEYKSQITLVDIGLLKLCLMSLGVLMGIAVPKGHRKKRPLVQALPLPSPTHR